VYTAEELLEFLSNWNIDALILTGILNQGFYEQLKTQPAPFLLVDSEVHDESRMQVHLKDREGGLMATRHLISLGHERILFCGPAPMEEGVIKERLMGYRQALQEAGLPFVQERLLLSPMGIREAADLGRFHRHFRHGGRAGCRHHGRAAKRRPAHPGGHLRHRL
jgi:LacI family transcriptional regulator